jgi:hypothetical protein
MNIRIPLGFNDRKQDALSCGLAKSRNPGHCCRVNLLVIPKSGGKTELAFEHDTRSVEGMNLWLRKMGKEAG